MGQVYNLPSGIKAQADSGWTLDVNPLASLHQIAVQPAAAVTGTIAISVRYIGKTDFEALLDAYNTPVVIDCAAAKTYKFLAGIDKIKFTSTSVSGNYTVNAVGWE